MLTAVVEALGRAPITGPHVRHFFCRGKALRCRSPPSLTSPPSFRCFYRLARQIDVCLLHNLRNPFVGTVHIFVDHADAVHDSVSADGVDASFWVETDWRPPFFKGLEEKVAGENCVLNPNT